ncbi:hypothetical protein Q5425_19125 [Amycolatopsis sp. A133]|uniref:hypothetical protein n=1 Tax=Amycolatopsis sp. A133 TaxID=3064472 RepID=UPI0027FE153F|nr:hypothetical protein [Amycolatopsis sp. A133]MDQ7805861.1 hypothetical protein [Amycolatopsis sp. A133]
MVGGAAAVSALAWLTATASASTVTQVADGPIGSAAPAVVTTIGDAQPPVLLQVTDAVPVVRDAATPALARTRELSGAAAHTARLADVLKTSAVPATVLAVGRIAATATDLTGLAEPADSPRDYVEPPVAGTDAAGPDDLTRAPANSTPREGSAGRSSVAIPVRAATTAIAGPLHTDARSDHGASGFAGQWWLPSCVVPPTAGLSSGHDRSCGDVVQPPSAEHPQPSHRRNRVLHQAVASAEIQPGVTPD